MGSDDDGSNVAKNDFYSDLVDVLYCKTDHPIGFLRAQHALCSPWVLGNLPPIRKILDIGCGAGMLANALAKAGHLVTGVDISEKSLNVARSHDETCSVRYLNANAYSLPFQDAEYDIVCVMDILEHVKEPHLLIGEAARVLKPKGTLFFLTINRTPTSYFLMIHGIDWCLGNSLKNMHKYSQFIKPDELEDMFDIHKLNIQLMTGMRPRLSRAFWKMLVMKQVPQDFSFCFSKSLRIGYCGYARKRGSFSIR